MHHATLPIGDGATSGAGADQHTLVIPTVRDDLTVEGRTALIVPVSGMGDAVETWRRRADPVAAGVPAHVTVLVPFLPLHRIDDSVRAWLASAFAKVSMPRELVFDQVRAFPTVVWLRPELSDRFVELTELVHRHWPECPPYEGQHETVIPHLTVAHGADVERLVRLDLTPELPITGRIGGVHLYAFTEGRWSDQAQFPFGD